MMQNSNTSGREPHDRQACDARVSRKEFLTTLIKRATLAGALLAAPKVVDKFLVPPAYAATSTTHFHDTTGSADTNHFNDGVTSHFHDGTSPVHDGEGTNHFHDSTSHLHDISPSAHDDWG
ncbi:MAG: hypothetical protein ACRD3W_02535 [Terriglobales bacterium]